MEGPWWLMHPRLRRLPRVEVLGFCVPVAVDRRARLLGLACLGREDCEPGLMLPECASIHTFGMRFELDVVFLDCRTEVLAVRREVPPRRLLWQGGAASVLELPAGSGFVPRAGGEFSADEP